MDNFNNIPTTAKYVHKWYKRIPFIARVRNGGLIKSIMIN